LNLNDKLRVVAAGDYKTRIDFKTRNELGVVARAFNHMVTELQAQQTEIKSKQQSLIDNQRVLEDQSDAVLNILEDIEEEKMRSDDLAADLKKFKLAADNTSDQVVITDPEGVILYANKSLETISGFAVEDVLGRKVATKELWGGLMEKDFYTQLWNTIKRKKQSFTGLIKNKRKSGEEYYVSATISPILDQKKEVNFFIGIERDVTKEKQIDLAKSEFVSLASHQLRTPLTAINWYMEMLLSSELGDLNSKQKEYAQHAFASNRRMTELVSSLLNVSRLELGTFIIEPKNENIIGIANGVLADLQHLIKIKRLRLVKDYAKNIPKQLKVDKRLLEICFQNLLTNAIKYTPEKGRITFSVEKKNGNIIICVSDTGYGIPRAQQDKIFTKLFRADNIKTVDPDGTGLGLYIVKSIMDHAGGRIWFHSEEKKGTKFYLSFPSTGMRPKKGTKSLD
jgi:PAS domain S-box-containing protein